MFVCYNLIIKEPNTMENEIKFKENLNQFYENLKCRYGRYNSWEYCYLFFNKFKTFNKYEDADFDIAALNLAFYLASWGMYRGSSFLLQYDYKIHTELIREIFENKNKYNSLWDVTFNNLKNEEFKTNYFDQLKHVEEIIKAHYLPFYKEIKKKLNNFNYNSTDSKYISDTLVTKILMGIFACIPAYDRFFIDGLNKIKSINKNKHGCKQCKKNCEKNDCAYIDTKYTPQSIEFLIQFIIKHNEIWINENNTPYKLHNDNKTDYPIMKLIDMCFWQIGYNNSFQAFKIQDNEIILYMQLPKRNDSNIIKLKDIKSEEKNSIIKRLRGCKTEIARYNNSDLDGIFYSKERLIQKIEKI